MLKIDKAIFDTNRVICENISNFSAKERGLLSQNILSQIRNFVEYIAIKIYSKDSNINPNEYLNHTKALKHIKCNGNLRFLYEFHNLLQISVSHYTVDKDASERLMLKYYEYLLKIKNFIKKTFNLDVLENIEEFPLNTDTELFDYYVKIAEKIESSSKYQKDIAYNERYYIQKIKPFFINKKVYYEVTFTTATDSNSKFNRIIAFTRHEILKNYAVKFSIHNDIINILDKNMSILIIDSYKVSIRPCEWYNFFKIFGKTENNTTNYTEYTYLNDFISTTKTSLTELISSDLNYYNLVKYNITSQAKSNKIFNILDQCRDIIINNKPGSNILRYLLFNMNNRIIKFQYNSVPCDILSDLCLNYGCIPFDHMPYCSSLIQHNPNIIDLFKSIPFFNREYELFARKIRNNIEIDNQLFNKKESFKEFKDIDLLIKQYNNALYYKHNRRRIEEYQGFIYIKEYIDNSTEIIKKLQELSSSGINQYTSSVDSWLSREAYSIDDPKKEEILRRMFVNSHVALIYGSAGTGKSTLINHISNFFANKKKIFLANTHPAVDNLRRKVIADNSEFNTISKFLYKCNYNIEYDVLFIDECSTVNNSDMQQILKKTKFKLLVLVGDIYQIESIYFGNWFNIARNFVPTTSVFELTYPYRTRNKDLLIIWDRVRKLDHAILEPLVKNGYVSKLDESIFEHNDNDEIILCLNYDGLYGINNINRFLQNNNTNKSIVWGINTYKIGDPILFNESNIFSPLIHNNTKGKIIDIHKNDQQIKFYIELDKSINSLDACNYNFELIGESKEKNSIISFCVNKFNNSDDDNNDKSTIIPFQVAYAVSIHKAQGLEYNSVKIVITNEVEERITHNIFYTAITRTKNKLKIYWSPETEKSILERFKIKCLNRDINLLAKFSSLTVVNKSK